jgi:hypothetical protein
VNDASTLEGHTTDDDFAAPVDMLDGMVTSYFERDDVPAAVDLANVYETLKENESQYAQPPDSFNVTQFLTSLLLQHPATPRQQQQNIILHQLIDNPEIQRQQSICFFNLVPFLYNFPKTSRRGCI